MDVTAVLLGFAVVSAIVLFLGALNYFLGRPQSNVTVSAKKSASDPINQQQSNRLNACGLRRKQARSAKRNQRLADASASNENSNSNNDQTDKDEVKAPSKSDERAEAEEESSVQPTDDEQEQNDEFYDALKDDQPVVASPAKSTEKEEEPLVPVKQRKRNKPVPSNASKSSSSSWAYRNHSPPSASTSANHESALPLKPQASVVPVKQAYTSTPTSNTPSNATFQTNHSKSNGAFSPAYGVSPHAGHSPLPPRFRRQQHEPSAMQRFQRRHSPAPLKKSSIPPESAARQNEFVPSAAKQQQPHTNGNNHYRHAEFAFAHHESQQNGYSSESDNFSGRSFSDGIDRFWKIDSLIETQSTVHTDANNRSSTMSTSTGSQHSFKGLDLARSSTNPTKTLDELITLFDNVSFSSEELELILNKITTKQLLNRQDWQRLLSSTAAKTDRTIERILEETYRSQAKILAIELQTEKTRVLELTKTNAEMDSTLRQLQQPNNSMLPYQQAILSYQMQLRRLTDENARLAHQLHAFSMMPGSINELKQQQQILDEQLRQLTVRNSALEKEVADGDRASKHAAEIYKKADAQKQERIEQMIADINRYRKIDKDLSALQHKHKELEKSSRAKLNDLIQQRNELKQHCEQFREQLRDEDEVRAQYDELLQNQTQVADLDELQRELSEVRTKNEVLRQRNWNITEQLKRVPRTHNELPSEAIDAI